MAKTSIKSEVQKVFKLIEAEKTLVASLAEIRAQLAEYGINTESVKAPAIAPTPGKAKNRAPRKAGAELTEEAVLKFIGTGHKTKGDLTSHFAGTNATVLKFIGGMKDKLEVKTKQGPKKNGTYYFKK